MENIRRVCECVVCEDVRCKFWRREISIVTAYYKTNRYVSYCTSDENNYHEELSSKVKANEVVKRKCVTESGR